MSDHVQNYFSRDISEVLGALPAVAKMDWSKGEITKGVALDLETGEPMPGGIVDPAIVGGGDGWGHIRLSWGAIHPTLASVIGDLLGFTADEVLAVAHFEAWITDDGTFAMPPGREVGDGEDIPFWAWPPTGNWTVTDWARGAVDDPTLPEDTRAAARRIVELHQLPRMEREDVEKAFEKAGPLAIYLALDGLDPMVAQAFQQQWGVPPRGLIAGLAPVPPATTRPLTERAGGVMQPDGANLALSEMVQALTQMQTFDTWLSRGEGVPRTQWAVEHIKVQRAFERFVAGVGGWLDEERWWEEDAGRDHWTPGGEPAREGAFFDRYAPLDPVRPTGLAFAGNELIVDFPFVTISMNLETGGVAHMCRTAGAELLATNGDETRALFTTGWDYLVRNLESGMWMEEPEPWPKQLFYEAMEEAYLVDRTRMKRRRLDTLFDHPTRLVISSDGDYVWASDKEGAGGVYRWDGELQFVPWWPGSRHSEEAPYLVLDGRLVTDEALSEDERDLLNTTWSDAAAFTLTPDNHWLVIDEGVFFKDLKPVFQLGFRADAAAFRSDGSQFAVASGTCLCVFNFNGEAPRLLARFDLEPLRRTLGPRIGDGRETEEHRRLLHSALSRWGTLCDLAALEDDEFMKLDLSNDFEVARPAAPEDIVWLKGLLNEEIGRLPEQLPVVKA